VEASSRQQYQEVLERLVKETSRDICFLLVGRTGVGKSSTINTLLGEKVAPVGKYRPTTMDVATFQHTHGGVAMRIVDTPGLCDDLPEAGNDQRYLRSMCDKVGTVDVMWFVTELDATRVSSDEKRGIKLITEGFGADIWRHAIIVFTRADRSDPDTFAEDLTERSAMIRQEIARYAPGVAANVPAVAVSNVHATLPNGEPWLGELFTRVFERIGEKMALRFLFAMRNDVGIGEQQQGDSRISLDEQQRERIRTSGSDRLANAAKGAAAGATIGGLVAGPVGSMVGAGVGAVLSFFL
jgi:energy-coupling factor transporter ATP-binding protein EcfA2